MKKLLFIILILCALTITYSIFDYLILRPKENVKHVNECLENVRKQYLEKWLRICKERNIEIKDNNCTLDSDTGDYLKKEYRNNQDICTKRLLVK